MIRHVDNMNVPSKPTITEILHLFYYLGAADGMSRMLENKGRKPDFRKRVREYKHEVDAMLSAEFPKGYTNSLLLRELSARKIALSKITSEMNSIPITRRGRTTSKNRRSLGALSVKREAINMEIKLLRLLLASIKTSGAEKNKTKGYVLSA